MKRRGFFGAIGAAVAATKAARATEPEKLAETPLRRAPTNWNVVGNVYSCSTTSEIPMDKREFNLLRVNIK